MIYSMTGFGAGLAECDGVRIRAELRSVNSRFVDIQVRCPNSMQEFSAAIKERLQQRISRGKVSVGLDWDEGEAVSEAPTLDRAVARAYLQGLEQLKAMGGTTGDVDLSTIASMPGLFKIHSAKLEPEALEKLVMEAVDLALGEFLQMRQQEGQTLTKDLRQRVLLIEEHLKRVAAMAEQARGRIQQKLQEKLAALLEPGAVPEDRLAVEVALLAERSDIAEEIVRFHSHNAQFIAALDEGGEVGRRLNFLLQEMHREANTISSKASETEITHLVVEVKEEVERLREQVQNLA